MANIGKRVEQIIANVEKYKDLIAQVERHIWENPEVGYKEWKTCAYLEDLFRKLGYEIKKPGDIPGFTAQIDTGRPGPTVAIIAEEDALFCPEHPEADKETGAVHACGHHAQSAYLVGCAAAFASPGALDGLSGSIRFISVPAEETIDLEYRNSLIEKGVIRYVAGKIEFLYRGYFDGVDMVLFTHIVPGEEKLFVIDEGSDGCITKHFEYIGKTSHAGSSPHLGINALYAAMLGMEACNSLRETFQEKDYIRWHPIITQGGAAANAIPGLVKMDTYVRASTFPKMLEVNEKINRALAASAAALGANVMIHDIPGNMPLTNNKELTKMYCEIAEELFGKGCVKHTPWNTGTSDLGDISCLMPTLHPYSTGAIGSAHGSDYHLTDVRRASINPAKVMCAMTVKLLQDDAVLAREIVRNYKRVFQTKEEYFAAIDQINMRKNAVIYREDGRVELDYLREEKARRTGNRL